MLCKRYTSTHTHTHKHTLLLAASQCYVSGAVVDPCRKNSYVQSFLSFLWHFRPLMSASWIVGIQSHLFCRQEMKFSLRLNCPGLLLGHGDICNMSNKNHRTRHGEKVKIRLDRSMMSAMIL